ncbi:hypothetical protein ScPMuIL_000431 [Solemya velum]
MASSITFQRSSNRNAKLFTSQKHAKSILKSLNNNRKIESLCDAVIDIEGNKIHVQKSVLAAASEYLRLVFSYGEGDETLKEPKKCTEKTLTSLQISADTFRAILDYIYTSNINLSDENIQDVLQAADILLIADLKDVCCEYLEGCISPNNCLGILEFSSRFSCPWIHMKVSQYVDQNFRQVMHSEEFLQISPERLCTLLSRDTLCISNEDDIVNAILRWYKKDPIAREPSIRDLFHNAVRRVHLSEGFLMKLAEEKSLSNQIFQKLVSSMTATQDARPRGFSNVLMVMGGECPTKHGMHDEEEILSAVCCIVVPNTSHSGNAGGRWIELAPMTKRRIGHGVVFTGGCLYVVGGRDYGDSRTSTTGEKYDPSTNKWTPIAPMQQARMGFGLVAVDENIYALGSSSDMNAPLTSVEMYNIFSDKWQAAPEMNLRRGWSSSTVVDKKIYVIAGGAIGKLFESVECYDTKTETWVSLSPMRERRCDARAVSVNDEIYVFGGVRRIECPSAMHEGHKLKFCGTEIYSTFNDNWTQLPPPSSGVGLCTMGDTSGIYGAFFDGERIYVIGELDIGGRYNCIRAFDIQTNTWQTVYEKHPPNQRGYSCTLVQFPTHKLVELCKKSGFGETLT